MTFTVDDDPAATTAPLPIVAVPPEVALPPLTGARPVNDDDPRAVAPGRPPLLVRWGRRLSSPAEDLHTARAEMTLALDDRLPLRATGLTPDPLTPIARAYAALDPNLGEAAEICLDLLPITPAARRAWIKDARRAHDGDGGPGGLSRLTEGMTGAVLAGLEQALDLAVRGQPTRTTAGRPAAAPAARPGPLSAAESRTQLRAVGGKVLTPEPVWQLQLLLRVRSAIPGRAEAHLHNLIAAMRQFAGENYLKVEGRNLGVVHLGADSRMRRGRFDQRVDTGRFRPRSTAYVTTSEIAGLLKPPSKHCAAGNVERGFDIPPPPAGLPTYSRDRTDLVPLGLIRTEDGWRPVGTYATETQFTLFAGRSGWGKTETSLGRFLASVRAGDAGGFLLDPHRDALVMAKEYLVDHGDRVLELDLSLRGADSRQAAWNPLSMEGFDRDDVDARAGAVVAAFSSAMGWSEVNTRALSIITMAAQSLCELALQLPPDLAPTIFQIPSILSNKEWREAVAPYLSPALQDYWTHRFGKVSDHITPVTNVIDRMRSSTTLAGVFGSSRSTYDVRRAMDTGQIVLACTSGLDDKERLIANLLVFDLLRAATSRKDIPHPADRRPFHAFIDELPTVDAGTRGTLAKILEQTRKFGLYLHAATQQPEALSQGTLRAFLTNRSHLFSSAVSAESAGLLARNWGNAVTPETVGSLQRYTHLAGITLAGEIHPPFLVQGLTVHQLFGDVHAPDLLDQLDAAIDDNLDRRPVAETITELGSKDHDILEALGAGATPPRPPSGDRRRSAASTVPVDVTPPPPVPPAGENPTPPDGIADLTGYRRTRRPGTRGL